MRISYKQIMKGTNSQGPNPLEGDGLAEALPDQTQFGSTTLGAK